MSQNNISILAEQYATAMAATHGGDAAHHHRGFIRIINLHEIDTATKTLTDAATSLEHHSVVPPPKDDRWTQSIGDNGEAAWLRDRADHINDQRYEDAVANAPLDNPSPEVRTAVALERIAESLHSNMRGTA
ncbi:MAG: hypothetical protein HLX51_00645 [Micrococcaceae bacterium]|nr:hypothetical protein [Micrococcaceae bacterium]